MFKKIFIKFKKNNKQNYTEEKIQESNNYINIKENNNIYIENNKENKINKEIELELNKNEEIVDSIEESINNLYEELKLDDTILITEDIFEENRDLKIENLSKTDLEYIKKIKIHRGKSIKSIDIYTGEEKIFKTHLECSKKLNLPLEYIKENLKYGYTDYFGKAIYYLQQELNIKEEKSYLDNTKSPIEIFNRLNNKIFTSKLSKEKIDKILGSNNIEPIKMHYRFECLDKEYDDYFKIYKSKIKRGGKKKIELINKKGEVIEIFKSLDDCAKYLDKDKEDIVNMLKYFDTKIGKNEIRYSLRGI